MRRRRAERRTVHPDPKYKSLTVSRFISIVMRSGKKSVAESIVYRSFDLLTQKVENGNPVAIFEKAVDNVRPLLQLKARRVGGATYQIPVEVRGEKGTGTAMRWIRDAARSRKGRSMDEKLADEIREAYNRQGAAMKKREEIHRMAEANRAFSHYRW